MQIQLRSWTENDIDSLTKYANNINIAKNLTNVFPHPYTADDASSFIKHTKATTNAKIFAIDHESEAIGAIGLHIQPDVFCKNAELGYWLAEPYWGKGIMTQCISEAIDFGFVHYDIDRIYARPFGSNIASQRVLQKCNFILEAMLKNTILKHGNREDELIFAIRKPSA